MYQPTIKRTCACCKNKILITKETTDVIVYKGLTYHTSCFTSLASARANKFGKYQQVWQQVYESIDKLQKQSYQQLYNSLTKDELNYFVLQNYDIAMTPHKFWTAVSDISNGKYKGKMCKPIQRSELLHMWRDYINDLNKIHLWQKNNGKEISGDGLIMYDLAVLMNKYPEWKRKQAKDKVLAAEYESHTNSNINYNAIKSGEKNNNDTDINKLVDEVW